MKNTNFFFPLAAFLFFFSNCETQKQAIRAEAFQQAKDSAITIILVRHAEKVIGPKNPDLTEAGVQRAKDLEYLLRKVDLDVVYSTDYPRTMQTARPSAEAKGLRIQHYNPGELGSLVDILLTQHKGETVLVVGHSNTTPVVANLLTNTNDLAHFDESIYDNILIVTAYGEGQAKVLRLKFGEKSE